MTLDSIAALTVETSFYELTKRLVDLTGVADFPYTVEEDDQKTFYDNVIMIDGLTKPTLQEYEDELVIYKAELTAEENARIAEINRKNDLFSRYDALHDERMTIFRYDATISNPKKWFKDQVEQLDAVSMEALMVSLETDDLVVKTEQDELKLIDDSKNIGRIARISCEAVLDLIAGENIKNGVTKSEIATLKATYKTAFEYIKDNQPYSAKAEIEGIDHPLSPKILKELSRFGI